MGGVRKTVKKRRDESGHAVFHMQKKSHGDARIHPCLEHRKTERIEVRSFQRIRNESSKLEPDLISILVFLLTVLAFLGLQYIQI